MEITFTHFFIKLNVTPLTGGRYSARMNLYILVDSDRCIFLCQIAGCLLFCSSLISEYVWAFYATPQYQESLNEGIQSIMASN